MADSVDEHVAVWSRELDWLDPVKEAIFLRISILARYNTQSRRSTLDDGGLANRQFKILLRLRGLGAPYTTSPSHLAELVGLTRGALSARLAPLEEGGLIERTMDAGDRRRVHVRLTDAGHAAFEKQVGAEENDEALLLSGLSEGERRTLADLLRKMVEVAEARGPLDDTSCL
ncbi:MarR family transcriptional regulator [Actinorhabdospora filicis]|uniref:MarR family transcriptional regulator n=1 Tax=Actinorhabdospora filicis TaxID=1785913 RepID=A0A9W6SLT5_9ACTN|nr:MarR family transcriptional regulator [Actinorhabdospora filicis]GLZ78114.1 MarR family transcriptional regulator [Actinorhabdospora filicis]